MKKIMLTVMACMLVLMPFTSARAAEKPLSSGVKLTQSVHNGTYTNKINNIQIDLKDSYTKVGIGLPSNFASRAATTTIANRDSIEGNRVVGAINGSFFHMEGTLGGFPIYLISKNNEIYYGGIISKDNDAYVNQPIAFGVTSNGLAEIDSYNVNISLNYNGNTYSVSGVNRQRDDHESILFTPQNFEAVTNSNPYGVQYVVETASPVTSTYFGQSLTGKVVKILPYGSTASVTIPKNGFVISAKGSKADELQSVLVGDQISVAINIDEKWKNSQFMIATGPMLVKDGARYITMSTTSSKATERTARSAVAISADKSKVNFITVDKTSSSKGMTLVEFANYIVSLGYDRAINLDGGGSTTMAYRNHGSNNVILANTPAYGSQRAISTILEAISTAPTSEAKTANFSRTKVGTLLAGTGSQVTVNYLLDSYYNPVAIDSSKLALVSEGKTLKINGMTFISTKAANDRIVITYDGKSVGSFPVPVVDAPATMTVGGSKEIAKGTTATYTVTAKDASGNGLIYDASMVKWSVEGGLGTIKSNGIFTAEKEGSGNIIATLGTKTVKYPIKVTEASVFTDLAVSHPYYNQLKFLAQNGYVSGYEDGSFKPGNQITRAQSALIIYNALKLGTNTVTNPNFADVPTSHIYYKQIAAVANAKIMTGKDKDGKTIFDPNGKLTRAQMAVIIANAYKLTGTSTKQFSDVPNGHFAYSYVQALAKSGVTTGYPDGTFQPNTYITRAHFGLFMYNAINLKK
ncbi:S-layer homology domain-containing protein [Ureibacillus chungkukjangi]|uniref:S-layer homology domain-containing protein n=1 Tax=Ureibacillus chungkukjangi TaxID=1202712 RepID=UPI00203C538C|nr:S-layer homology domain-containing protein [Ureibacillus chungkukjangi]MCM3389121.1 S-layer homology domain-containing protein [Ureibacillus chungkukjangi]